MNKALQKAEEDAMGRHHDDIMIELSYFGTCW